MPETRGRILDATCKLLRLRTRPVRLEDVARTAGVSRQALYLHFGDRTALLIAAAQHVDERLGLEKAVESVSRAKTPGELVDRLIEMYADVYPQLDPLVQALQAARGDDRAADAALRDRTEHRRMQLADIVRRLRATAALAPEWTIGAATDVLFALSAIETWRLLVVELGLPRAAYVAQMTAAMRRVLLRGRHQR